MIRHPGRSIMHALGSYLMSLPGRTRYLAAVMFVLMSQAVSAATIVVDHFDDFPDSNLDDGLCLASGVGCTLRAAVEHASILPNGPHTIEIPRFPAGESPVVTLYTICIPDSMTIRGSDPTPTKISGIAPASQIFSACGTGEILLENLEFTPFEQSAVAAFGTTAILTLRDVKFEASMAATSTVGLEASGDATVICERCNFNGGAAPGVLVEGDATLQLIDSVVQNYRVSETTEGAGMRLQGGTVHIIRSLITNNWALDPSDSSSQGIGGGIWARNTDLVIVNSTISRNQAAESGGGIWFQQGSASIRNSTIAYNIANGNRFSGTGDWFGGGIFIGNFGIVRMQHSILAENEAYCISPSTPGCTPAGFGFECFGLEIESMGYNLYGKSSGCTVTELANPGTDIFDTPTLLDDALINLGGMTLVHPLLEGSPAIDGGDPAGCYDDFDLNPATVGNLLALDQRGESRPTDGDGNGSSICDIGAFELEGQTLVELIFTNSFE